MWLSTNRGFYSVVAFDPKKAGAGKKAKKRKIKASNTHVLVRCRVKEHMEILTKFAGSTLEVDTKADYHFRTIISKGTWERFMAAETERIDYTNFKNSVKDNDLHDAYMSVWSTMIRLQRPKGGWKSYLPANKSGSPKKGGLDTIYSSMKTDEAPLETPSMRAIAAADNALKRGNPRKQQGSATFMGRPVSLFDHAIPIDAPPMWDDPEDLAEAEARADQDDLFDDEPTLAELIAMSDEEFTREMDRRFPEHAPH